MSVWLSKTGEKVRQGGGKGRGYVAREGEKERRVVEVLSFR